MSEELAWSRAKRGGNRTVLTKLANEAHGLLKEGLESTTIENSGGIDIREVGIVKSLDEAILETCKVEDIEVQIEESYEINERALETRRRIMDALAAVRRAPTSPTTRKLVELMCPWCPLNRLLFLEMNTQMKR